MCGIAGVVTTGNATGLRASVEGVVRHQAHRGPDASGLWVGNGAVLGHNRLSIIDLSGGAQPMQDETGRYVIVFNGEIYNFRDLRKKLEAAGQVFRTTSDTEILLTLYIQSRERCLQELNGMFAFAVWDNAERSLFLARDRLGVKPVYYTDTGRELYFSSEFGALATSVGSHGDLDAEALVDYLSYLYVPAPRTIYTGIRKLPPAHWLSWRDGQVRSKCYWSPWNIAPDARPSEQDWIERIKDLFVDATRSRLISDVPLGAFLSGGVDSSAVVSTMALITNSPVKTFTIGFEGDDSSEISLARAIAERYNTDHTEHVVAAPDVPMLLDLVTHHFGEPFADSSAIPTLMVCGIARERVTVALSGDGGDELFAGYGSYRYYDQLGRLKSLIGPLDAVVGGAARLFPRRLSQLNAPVSKARNFLAKLGRPLSEQWSVSRSVLSRGSAVESLAPELRARFENRAWCSHLTTRFDPQCALDPLDQLARVDMQTYLPDDLLVKVDRMSMAKSLEVRSPFLDYRLVELALRIPMKYKLRNGSGKWILRRMLEPQVPHDILWRRKQGFTMPLENWFRGDLRNFARDMLYRLAARNGFLERKGVDKILREHASGRADHDDFIWALMVLESWLAKNGS